MSHHFSYKIGLLPVSIEASLALTHEGITIPKKRDVPSTKRFLIDDKSTYWSDDKPTARIIPNITMKIPPITGSGTVANNAPNFPMIESTIMIRAPHRITRTLPTCIDE